MTKIFKQFDQSDYPQYKYLFAYNSGDNYSKTINSPNLFGWDDDSNNYFTNGFRLELVYG